MTPASNSEARKRTESPGPSVLVEIPVDLAYDAMAALDLIDDLSEALSDEAHLDHLGALSEVCGHIGSALDARVSDTTIGDRVRPDAAGWAGRHG